MLTARAAESTVRSCLRPGLLALALMLVAGRADAACSSVDPAHASWSAILGRWVDDGRVDYAGLQRDGEPALNGYLATLSGACGADYERWTSAERLTFWINAYNAFTVRLILDHYPIASIRKIGWLPGAAFRTRFIPMEGLKGALISLDDIENATIRSAFREPRIHFALVCAAQSCPPLRGEAYRGVDLERQLDDQARRFLGDPAKNRIDVERRTLHLSSIFRWFRDDFESAGVSLASYVGRYWGRDVAGFDVRFLDYDWQLNDRKGGSPL